MSSYVYNAKRGFNGLQEPTKNFSVREPSIFAGPSGLITFVETDMRAAIDMAAGEKSTVMHANSITEIVRSTREQAVGTIIFSPRAMQSQGPVALDILLRQCPGFAVILVIRSLNNDMSKDLLAFGALGVRTVVDLSRKDNQAVLRQMLDCSNCRISQAIAREIQPALLEAPMSVQQFFLEVLRLSPQAPTVADLGQRMGLRSTTLSSRFFRAKLPTVKFYLASFRILHALAMLADKRISIARVSVQLGYSSPQSFSRHVHTTMGVSASVLRSKHGFGGLLYNVIDRLFVRYRHELKSFQPYGSSARVDAE